TIAAEFVALAMMGGSPSQTSTGKLISVPPPATEFTAPATKAATKATTTCPRLSEAGITEARYRGPFWTQSLERQKYLIKTSMPAEFTRKKLSLSWYAMPSRFD